MFPAKLQKKTSVPGVKPLAYAHGSVTASTPPTPGIGLPEDSRFRLGIRRRNERGATLVLFTVLLATFILPGIGLAIDGTIAFVAKAQLSAAADAAVLAGARALCIGPDQPTQAASAQSAALAYFNANFPNTPTDINLSSISVTRNGASRTVKITVTAQVPVYFMRILNFQQVSVQAVSAASRRDVNLMLVLDRSGSMTRSGACEPMKTAAEDFAGKFANQSDVLGEISFMASPHIDFALNSDFNDANPSTQNIIQTIASIQCPGANGGTGTAEALSLAHNQFKSLLQSSAYNIVVLFTDGNPDAVAAHLPITNSACQPNVTPRFIDGILQNVTITQPGGGYTLQAAGIWQDTGWPVSQSSDVLITSPGGCKFQKAPEFPSVYNAYQDAGPMPPTDLSGNSISGYAGSNPTNPGDANQLREAALNTADNAGESIRADKIQIYTIGEGSLVDASATEFLERAANLPPYTNPDPNQPVGYYVYAPTKNQLASAFNIIALQILRLAQ